MESIEQYLTFDKTDLKPLNERDKRWIIQNDIFEILKKDDELKRENYRRYIRFLKKYRLSQNKLGADECVKRWRRSRKFAHDKDVREIKPISKSTLGFFTSHLNLEDLFYTRSVCSDKIQRHESPTIYIYSFQKFDAR